jgi:hypothetical protein
MVEPITINKDIPIHIMLIDVSIYNNSQNTANSFFVNINSAFEINFSLWI